MLSCRYSGPGSIPYARRLASADRILEIIGQGGHETLPPLPLVPYAISMSTTMIYRALRDGQRDAERASRDMKQCCGALDGLSRSWTSARGVAQLARRLWKILSTRDRDLRSEVDRTAAEAGASGHETGALSHLASNPPSTGEAPSAYLATVIPPAQALGESDYIEETPSRPWDSMATYSQLDTAFHGLFDYGVPNVFRDTSAMDFLHLGSEGLESLDAGASNGAHARAQPHFRFAQPPDEHNIIA